MPGREAGCCTREFVHLWSVVDGKKDLKCRLYDERVVGAVGSRETFPHTIRSNCHIGLQSLLTGKQKNLKQSLRK